jgi:Leucine-rich repeat (LRR) protein
MGLENIFKPPAPTASKKATADDGNETSQQYEEDDEGSIVQHEVTMPSSPPMYQRDPSTVEIRVDDSAVDDLPRLPGQRGPNQIRYRRNDESELPSESSALSETPDVEDSHMLGDSSEAALPQPGQQHLQVVEEGDMRKVSGQTVLNEDFSPILLTRRNAENGPPTFTPLEVPPTELRKRLEKLRRNQMVLMAESDDGLDASGKVVENSDELQTFGGFINLRRGGRSADDSFRHRLLSSGLDTSGLNLEESLQASTPKQFPTVRMQMFEGLGKSQLLTPQYPRAPRPSPEKRGGGTSQGSNGSPLKLFQPYDTFTNQTLLRRLSQFEGNMEEVSPSVRRQHSELEGQDDDSAIDAEGEYMDETAVGQQRPQENRPRRSSVSISQFGAGQLDGYEFQDDMTFDSHHDTREAADGTDPYELEDDAAQRPQPPRSPIFKISHSSSPLREESITVPRSRKNTASSAASSRYSAKLQSSRSENPTQNPLFKGSLMVPNSGYKLTTPKRRDMSEAKRARTSPAKDPTPKRRRTLHKSDIAYASIEQDRTLDSVQLSHQQMQSAVSRKHKDSFQGDARDPADPKILALRDMLRPRTPTPSQRSSVQRDRAQAAEEEDEQFSDGRGLSSELDDAYSPIAARPVSAPMDTDRKPSIRTEDFINEANKIMDMIRNKAGLGNGLPSLEESDSEHIQLAHEEEDSFQESTKEPFSRPPSRDGPPLQRIALRQEDPEVVMRLKQYEERSDMGDLISSSMRSVGVVLEQHESPGRISSRSSGMYSTEDDEVISDPPGIRISRGLSHKPTESLRDGFLTTGSNASGHSTSRSNPTSSSLGSVTRRIIAPESVQHLIPDQVGNMVLDKQRNIWIKRKGSVKSVQKQQVQNWLPSEGSEDDPFADIPDLTVDMTMEMRNLRIQNARKAEEARLAELEMQKVSDSPESSPAKGTVKGSLIGSVKKLVGPSPLRSMVYQPDRTPSKSPVSIKEIRVEEEVEHEIGIHEDRVKTPRKRNLTITFSSPIASIIQDVAGKQIETTTADKPVLDKRTDEPSSADSMSRGRRNVSVCQGQRKTSRSRSSSRLPARQLSVRGEAFVPRPVSRIEEREEDDEVNVLGRVRKTNNLEVSIVGDNSLVQQDQEENRHSSVSFLFSTPARPNCPPPGIGAANLIAECVGNLSLSPMPDFTIHGPDQSLPLEVSYVLSNHHLTTKSSDSPSKRVMSMATKDLVQKLAEVEPFEPYWEDMQELDLQDKSLDSLHQLDSFCGQLVSLDASQNNIRNLGGIPSSVRQLRVTHNQLSSLTAWAHLVNLQYVDVSNNGLTSLSAFQSLVHLRSLRADNNAITSLDGVKYHDGLQILRVRGNCLEDIDFDNTALHRLTELDLRSNQIRSLANADQLTALSTLYLDKNELETLPFSDISPLPELKYLSMSDNNLTSLSLRATPNLRLLHADRNSISSLAGLDRCRRLDSLSLREQRLPQDTQLNLSFLNQAFEVRKLYLSGNFLEEFDPQADFLNLQFLELANCGLAHLPEDLGALMPNLRTVNLDFNALDDLSPLRYIPRLKRLLAAGNRLSDGGAIVEVLSGFPHLRCLDLRDNPVTQGFYAPMRGLVVKEGEKDKADEFSLPDQDADGDLRYASRLDIDTRMRRRLYETVVVEGCVRLKLLDGLTVRRDVGKLRDGVWRGLVAKGLIKGNLDDVEIGEPEGGVQEASERSKVWQAEDSFA